MGQVLFPAFAALTGTLVANSTIATNSGGTAWELRDVSSATSLTSGTLPDARLSSNVPLKDAANVFTGDPQTMVRAVFSESPAAGTGRIYLKLTKRTGEDQDFNLVAKYTAQTGGDNRVVALGHNVPADISSPEAAGVSMLYDAWESDWDDGGGNRVKERHFNYRNAAGVLKRFLGVYINATGDVMDHINQADSWSLTQTDAAYDAASAWFSLHKDFSGTGVPKMTAPMNMDAFRTTASTQWRIGQGGNDNLFLVWNYNATAANASATIGTWGAQPLNLQTTNNGAVNIAASGGTLGFFGATAVVKPTSTTDLRTALINLGLYTTGGATPLNLNGGAFTTSGNVTATGTGMSVNSGGGYYLAGIADTNWRIGKDGSHHVNFWGGGDAVRAWRFLDAVAGDAVRASIVMATGSMTLAGRAAVGFASVAYAASITPNCDAYNTLNVGELTGDITINAPTGTPVDGQMLKFRFDLDGSARTITWNAAFSFGTDVTSAMIPTTANAKFEVAFQYHAGDTKWRSVGLVRGF